MEPHQVTAWLYLGGTLFFFLSASLGAYPPYLLCALLYFGGSLALFFFVALVSPQRVRIAPLLGSALRHQGNSGGCYFYRKTDRFGIQSDDSKICVVMVGLPARGKSLIAGKGMFVP